MPNRIIEESIRTSKTINSLTDFQFRLWAYLLTYVDDYGRGSADPELLKGFVFPRRKSVTEATIKSGLTDLANTGLISLYSVDGESYLCFPTWAEHQRVQQKRSKFPPPPAKDGDDSEKPTVTHGDPPWPTVTYGDSREPTVNNGDSPSESNPNPNPNPNPIQKASASASALDVAMADFEEFRKKIRKPLTDRARELTLMELEKLAPGDMATQVEIINQSIQRGWQGVFPLDWGNAKRGAKPAPQTYGGEELPDLTELYGGGQK